MDSHFRDTKNKLQQGDYKELTLVFGNESCDLDSAVTSVVLAIFLSWKWHSEGCQDNLVVPVLDVDRSDYDLKTEIKFSFDQARITAGDLIFRNDFDFKDLVERKKTNVILVDHHVLSDRSQYLKEYVTEIIDHRPTDVKVKEYKDAKLNIEVVGSCATLVAQICKENNGLSFFNMFPDCAELLHSAIIMDTANFSEVMKKTTPLDVEMAIFLEDLQNTPDSPDFYSDEIRNKKRSAKLSKLSSVKSNVSNLTAPQLLRKDAKVTGTVFVPGFPILVKEFLEKPNAMQSIAEALKSNGCTLCILLGMNYNGENLERDIAVYNTTNDSVAKELSSHLKSWKEPDFELTPIQVSYNLDYYQQNNLQASRKQYMPAIQEFLNKL